MLDSLVGYEGAPMNRKPNRACREPGCVGYAAVGSAYCSQHAAAHARAYRSTEDRKASARLYHSGQWLVLRAQHLAHHPFCVQCLKAGRYTMATEVDHVVPHRNDISLFYDASNLQSLCHACHSQKTAREDGGFGREQHIRSEVLARERVFLR